MNKKANKPEDDIDLSGYAEEAIPFDSVIRKLGKISTTKQPAKAMPKQKKAK